MHAFRADIMLQHGNRYGDILMPNDMINTYGWFSSKIDTNYILVTNHYTFPVYIFLVKYAI